MDVPTLIAGIASTVVAAFFGVWVVARKRQQWSDILDEPFRNRHRNATEAEQHGTGP